MAEKLDLLLKNGICVLPDAQGKLTQVPTHVGLRDEKIVWLGNSASQEADTTIDLTGLHVLPGLIDTQVHFREPGGEHKEDLATGTLGALLGGITAVFDMPNTSPATTSALAFHDKVSRAQGRVWCDTAFYMGACAENADRLEELSTLPGCCGIKVFMGSSTGNLLVNDDQVLEQVMASGSKRISLHCEDENRLKDRRQWAEQSPATPLNHPLWRDEQTAFLATQKAVTLAEKHQRPIHVLHVTTAEEMEFLKNKKHIASVECTPQHLTLSSPDCYERLGTLAQMNPPIREERHRLALWEALSSGVVDIIGSDHAPHTREEKAKPYPQSPSGMPGVQTIVPVMLHHVSQGRLTLERLVELMVVNPTRLFKIKNLGRIEVGYQANLTIVDLKKKATIENSWMATKSGWTPFDGMNVTGWPVSTLLRGQIVMRDNEVTAKPAGRMLEFKDNQKSDTND